LFSKLFFFFDQFHFPKVSKIQTIIIFENFSFPKLSTELLPSIIFALKSGKDTISGENGKISISKFVFDFIGELCGAEREWAPKIIAPIIHILNELNLSDREIESAVNKAFKSFQTTGRGAIILSKIFKISKKIAKEQNQTLLYIFFLENIDKNPI